MCDEAILWPKKYPCWFFKATFISGVSGKYSTKGEIGKGSGAYSGGFKTTQLGGGCG